MKRSPAPPRADVVCPVCAAPKRYPCKVFNEKTRKMVPLRKIHPEREVLQQQWLESRRQRLDPGRQPADGGDFRRY